MYLCVGLPNSIPTRVHSLYTDFTYDVHSVGTHVHKYLHYHLANFYPHGQIVLLEAETSGFADRQYVCSIERSIHY